MKKTKLYILAVALLALAGSCTKVIDIKTGNDSGKLDIEANIVDTTGVQTITLSKNVPFTSTNVYPAVTGATVSVADASGNSYLFIEGPAGTYTNSQLTGVSGTNYKLTVASGGISYNAASTMPANVVLDSVTSQNRPLSNGSNPKKQIVVHYQDQAGIPNYYRFVLFINGVQVKSVFVFDDEFNDGLYVNNILRIQDDDNNSTDIYAGDKVTVIMQCIDQPMYLYWFTLAQQGSGPGGITPSDPPTNISPITLGYFSAHTTQSKTVIVK